MLSKQIVNELYNNKYPYIQPEMSNAIYGAYEAAA